MKRRELLRRLERHGCGLFREGARHSVFVNRAARKSSTVPRHREVDDSSRARSRELKVPEP
jgi:mRNA interferase HicA